MSLVKSYALPLLALSLIVAGVPNASAQPPTPQSISNPPPLEPARLPGSWKWWKPGFSLMEYDKLLLEPPTFFIHDKSDEKGIKPEELQVSGGALRSHIINALEPDYAVVNKPGPGVLLMRPAITNIKLKKEARAIRGIFGYLPAGLAINAIQEAAGRSLEVEHAIFELEVLDSVSLERVAVGRAENVIDVFA